MTKYPPDHPKAPSEEMMRAIELVSMSGTCRITCEFCGRVHFTSSGGFDFDEGELEELQRKAEEQPDRCIDHGDVTVAWGTVANKQCVVDCPCNLLRPVEAFIVHNRRVIVEYLELRAKRIVENAKDEAELAERVRAAEEQVSGP